SPRAESPCSTSWSHGRERLGSTTSTTARIRTTSRPSRSLTKERRASEPCWRSRRWRAWPSPSPRSGSALTRSFTPTKAGCSFYLVSEFDSAELTNALDQARREVGTRYDFKDTATIYDLQEKKILIESASEERA